MPESAGTFTGTLTGTSCESAGTFWEVGSEGVVEGSRGLFVGVGEFEDERFSALPFAPDDAVDLAYLFVCELGLLPPAGTVLALAGEPRKPESREHLAELLAAGARRIQARQRDLYHHLPRLARDTLPQGLLVLSIASHGVSDQGKDFALTTESARERLVRTAVEVAELFDDLEKAHAKRRLVFLDACRERLHTGTRSVGEGAVLSPSLLAGIEQAHGQATFAAATLGGVAYDDNERKNGVFTAAVLDGLRGKAEADARGFITVRTLADYVQTRVAAWVEREYPGVPSDRRGISYRAEGPVQDLPLARGESLTLGPAAPRANRLAPRLAPWLAPRRRLDGRWLGARWRGLSRRTRAALLVAVSAVLLGVGWYFVARDGGRQPRNEVPLHLMTPAP